MKFISTDTQEHDTNKTYHVLCDLLVYTSTQKVGNALWSACGIYFNDILRNFFNNGILFE